MVRGFDREKIMSRLPMNLRFCLLSYSCPRKGPVVRQLFGLQLGQYVGIQLSLYNRLYNILQVLGQIHRLEGQRAKSGEG